MSQVKPQVEIVRESSGYRAIVRLTRRVDWTSSVTSSRGVRGASTAEGPWVDARGDTPEAALERAYTEIGRVVATIPIDEVPIDWRWGPGGAIGVGGGGGGGGAGPVGGGEGGGGGA